MARIDSNQNEIVQALRKVGTLVYPTHTVGGGFPDLVVYRHSCGLALLELKDGAQPESKRKLTPDEAKFHAKWAEAPVYVVESVEDALRIVGATD